MENSCNWPTRNKLMLQYHDEEWGVPLHDDQKLFEFLVLEGFQAGLSWQTVLNKREAFRESFDGFLPEKVALYQEADVERLMNNSLIIRNKQKIQATISNARYFLEIQKAFGSFDHYIWGFLNFKPVINEFSTLSQLPATSELSDAISKDLRMRGFKFVGSTIVYAHMQATGMVNDHLISCSRYHEIIMMNK
jgi:DNA-3-methyladenine glycosylase I